MSVIYQLFVRQVRLLKLKTALRILIISIGITSSVNAQSLNEYCLSTVGQIETANKTPVFDPTPPLPYFIDSVENLPELYEKPCNKIYRFFWESCDRETFFSYSPTLNKAFIQGYRRTNWGGDFAHLEISPSGTKSVPESLVNSGFSRDIPALNGALFRGRSKGEALFYDGDKITNLFDYFPRLKEEKQSLGWYFTQTSKNRMFLVVDFVRSKGNPFLIELKPGLKLNFIYAPKSLKNRWLKLFTLSNDSDLWVVSRKSILTEVDGKLQDIIIVSSSSNIQGPINVEQMTDGSISFQVENTSTKSTKNYFLRQASPIANCEIMLDANKPVLLEPESEN